MRSPFLRSDFAFWDDQWTEISKIPRLNGVWWGGDDHNGGYIKTNDPIGRFYDPNRSYTPDREDPRYLGRWQVAYLVVERSTRLIDGVGK